jgi:hypothetical protein
MPAIVPDAARILLSRTTDSSVAERAAQLRARGDLELGEDAVA